MLILVVIASLSCVMAQRPMYAGSRPIGAPDLANRFKDPNAETTTDTTLNNRFGTNDGADQSRIPIDAMGDRELVNRLNQWPKEHRPFWLINAEAIEAQRNQNVNRGNQGALGNQNTQSNQGNQGFVSNQGNQGFQGSQGQGGFQPDQQGQNDFLELGSRGNFDGEVPSLPIRPQNQKPTFWGGRN